MAGNMKDAFAQLKEREKENLRAELNHSGYGGTKKVHQKLVLLNGGNKTKASKDLQEIM